MINVSSRYKEAMSKKLRDRAYISIGIGVVNQNAQENASINAELSYWSNGNVFDVNNYNIEYATLEQNFFKTDGSMYFLPENVPESQYLLNGITTLESMGGIRIDFDNLYSIKGITVDFGETYPTAFSIKTSEIDKEYENNKRMFETYDFIGYTNYIEIKPLEMLGGDKRLRIKSILLGVGLQFSNKNIKSCETKEYASGISSELPGTNLNFSFYDENNMFNVDDDNSFIDFLNTMQEIKLSFGITLDNGEIEWNQIAKCYLSEWDTKDKIVSISSTDRLSQMEDEYSLSGRIYDRNAYEEAYNIFNDSGLLQDEYFIDEYLKDIQLHNPMPRGTHKECLQILANACRCIINIDENGVIYIKANFATVIDPQDFVAETNGITEWSDMSKLMIGTNMTYAELTRDFFKVDGNMYFLPEDNDYMKTSYVSSSISDSNGLFEVNPMIEISLPASYSYYGLRIEFNGNAPKEMIISTYNNGTVLNSKTYTELENKMFINDEFLNFDKISFEFTRTVPNNRVLVNVISFGDLSDYVLTKDDMMSSPYGQKEKKTKSVRCKVYTYEQDEQGNIKEVEDEVYAVKTIGNTGEIKTISNPLVSTMEHAELLAEWIGSYYSENTSYSVDYRGEPRINAGDIIHMESDILNNLQVEITEHTLKFDGAFSGSLELRRVAGKEGN